MSYKKPDILILTNPIGIDAVIQSIQLELYAGLTWLEKSFGRAWEFQEKDQDGRTIRVPKAYMGLGEYHNVLPNDFLKSQCFIACRGEESNPNYVQGFAQQSHERQLSVIFWFNLKEIDPGNDTIFTELLKSQVEKILNRNPYVQSIDRYYDERAEDVFDGNVSGAMAGRYDVGDGQYLMYPYSGFRFDITVGYPEHVDCSTWNNWPFPDPAGVAPGESVADIQFRVGSTGYDIAGQTTLVVSQAIGRKVRLFRGGVWQTQYNNNGRFWSFTSATGTITVNPAWSAGEDVGIQIF